jgi:hypothetical protein
VAEKDWHYGLLLLKDISFRICWKRGLRGGGWKGIDDGEKIYSHHLFLEKPMSF